MNSIRKFFIATAIIAVSMTSCTKDDDPDKDEDGSGFDTQSSQDNAKMDGEFEIIGKIMQEEMEVNEAGLGNAKTSATGCVSINTTIKRITIDFGSGTCTDYDGRTRTGKLYIDYTGDYRDSGAVFTTWTENYTVDGDTIEGQRRVTNLGGTIGAAGMKYKVQVSAVGDTTDYAYWTNGTETITWKSTRTRTWTADGGTPLNPCDDVYTIFGTADGVSRTGRAFTMTVEESDALLIDLSCYCTGYRIPKDGILTISPSGLEDRIIDYGAGGSCDYTVNITVGIFSFDFTIPTN